MIQPVIARKPKFVINPQRSPTLGFGLDTPVHYATRVFLPGSQKIINLPIVEQIAYVRYYLRTILKSVPVMIVLLK